MGAEAILKLLKHIDLEVMRSQLIQEAHSSSGQRRRKATGAEGMVGKPARAKTPLDPTGTVSAEGELWTATSEGENIAPGEEVIITKVENLKLWVTRKSGK